MPQKVAIIGAGPAGLAAAKALIQYPNLSAVVFEAKSALGGLWATSGAQISDGESTGVRCPPRMRTNLSRFTCSFSDFPWRAISNDPPCNLFPRAHEVQKYLQDYASTLSEDIFRFNTRVTCVQHKSQSQPHRGLWNVSFLQNGGEETTEDFDFVVVASGFFARPWVPQFLLSRYDAKNVTRTARVLHSSEYAFDRVLSLFPSANTPFVDHLPRKRKIVVIGGSLSAVEVVSDLCININSIPPDPSSARETTIPKDVSNWEVIHVSPRPFWVLPRFLPHLNKALADTSPPRFFPLDLILYDAAKLRNLPAHDVPPSEAEGFFLSNTNLRTLLGYKLKAQADLSPDLEISEENGWMSSPPWVTISDTYANFLKEKRVGIVIGHITGANVTVDSNITLTLTPNSSVNTITDVDVIISCTGYTPSLDTFLSPEILHGMEYSPTSSSKSDVTFLPAILPQQIFLPCSTNLPHQVIKSVGFVGMYKGPYFGVIELQARYLAALFAGKLDWPEEENLSKDAEEMTTIRRSREKGWLEEDGSRERKQWSWGDYMGVMKGLADQLGIVETPFPTNDSSAPPRTEIDPIIPAYFADPDKSQDAITAIHALRKALNTSFLPISVFRALHGSWKVHRRIDSHLADVPGGIFEGTAIFLPRLSEDHQSSDVRMGHEHYDYEYLYCEHGTFTPSNNLELRLEAKRKYVYRYEEDRDVISVWFVKGDGWTTDNLFHEISDFDGTGAVRSAPVCASGTRHLCGPDTYNTSYHFSFLNSGPELKSFSIRYRVEGPKKNYISDATYECLNRLQE